MKVFHRSPRPTGISARRVWFLYEWLLGKQLELPDSRKVNYVDARDPKQQWAGTAKDSPRHRVRDNLPGTPAFCPLVFRTPALDEFVGMDLAAPARAVAADVPADLLARTAAFLLLKDSRASYVIEGEDPPQAEFLYACVKKTALDDLPKEADYLRRYDAFMARVEAIVEMPDSTIDLLFRVLRRNRGKLSNRAREKEFALLTADEAHSVEQAYEEAFLDWAPRRCARLASSELNAMSALA